MSKSCKHSRFVADSSMRYEEDEKTGRQELLLRTTAKCSNCGEHFLFDTSMNRLDVSKDHKQLTVPVKLPSKIPTHNIDLLMTVFSSKAVSC